MTHRSEHVVRIGSKYRPNDSQWAFIVLAVDGRWAQVTRLDGTHRRNIQLTNLHPSTAKHGYTLLELGPEVEP